VGWGRGRAQPWISRWQLEKSVQGVEEHPDHLKPCISAKRIERNITRLVVKSGIESDTEARANT